MLKSYLCLKFRIDLNLGLDLGLDNALTYIRKAVEGDCLFLLKFLKSTRHELIKP